MREAIRCKWPGAEVRPFGSYPAGLSVYSSDLDLTILGIELGRGSNGSATSAVEGLLGAASSSGSSVAHSVSIEPRAVIDLSREVVVPLGDFEELADSQEDGFADAPTSSESEGEVDQEGYAVPGAIIDLTGDTSISYMKVRGDPSGHGGEGGGSSTEDEGMDGSHAHSHSDSDSDASSRDSRAGGKSPRAKQPVFDDIEVNAVTPSNARVELDFSRTTVTAPLRGTYTGAAAKSDGIREGVHDMYRDERIQVLQSMCHFFGGMGWLDYIELRKRARVPIINLRHKLGVECDVSLGVAAENTTAEVELMKLCFPDQFKVVAFFLKVFLARHKLDKPFTGGIGSYKLYVMISYIFRRVKTALADSHNKSATPREAPTAGFLLLTFLKFFGDVRNLNPSTALKVPMDDRPPSSTPGGDVHLTPSTDFKTAFKVDVCREAFRLAYQILNDNFEIAQMQGGAEAAQVGKKRKIASPESCIAKVLVDARSFIKEREAVRMSCGGMSVHASAASAPRTNPSTSTSASVAGSTAWPQRTEEDREAVATTILAALQRRLQISTPITMSDIYRTDPGVAVRLRSFASLDDALRQIEASRSVSMSAYGFTSSPGHHHPPPSLSAPHAARGTPGSGFGGRKVRKVHIKATQSSAAHNALIRDGALRTAAKPRTAGPLAGGGRGVPKPNPYPFSMSLPSSNMGASTSFKNKRYYKPKYS
jgi:hypothetical protein